MSLRRVDKAILFWALLHIAFAPLWHGAFEAVLLDLGPGVWFQPFYVHMALVVLSVVLIMFHRATFKIIGYILCGLALVIETFATFPESLVSFVFGDSPQPLAGIFIVIPFLQIGLLVWVVYSIFAPSNRLDGRSRGVTDEQGQPEHVALLARVIFALRRLDVAILIWAGVNIVYYDGIIEFVGLISEPVSGTDSPLYGYAIVALAGLSFVLICIPRPRIKRLGYAAAAIAFGTELAASCYFALFAAMFSEGDAVSLAFILIVLALGLGFLIWMINGALGPVEKSDDKAE